MHKSSDANIDDIAARWVAREDHGTLSAADIAARDAWLSVDGRHFGAYARARAVLARMDRARALSDGGVNVLAIAPQLARRQRRRSWGWAAAAALLLGVTGLAWQQQQGGVSVYATSKGEILRVPLADGSAITLDSASRVRVHFTERQRSIELLQGEALFDVAKNPERPFIVHARDTDVTAVGTSFAVNLNARRTSGVEVLVREGVVEVANRRGEVAPARLPANYRALSSRNHGIQIESVPRKELRHELAWREGMLSFNGDTLSAAVAQFQRYSDARIVISDPAVGSRRIVGLYSASDPQGFARSVALSLGLVLERDGNVLRLLSSSAKPASTPPVKPSH